MASFPAGDGPDGVAVDGNTVLVTNSAGDTLTRLDADTGKRRGAPVPVGQNPDGVAAADGVAWVASTDDGSVTRVPVGSGGESPTTVEVGAKPEGIALGRQLVWVANSGDRTVSRIDRASPQLVGHADRGGRVADRRGRGRRVGVGHQLATATR